MRRQQSLKTRRWVLLVLALAFAALVCAMLWASPARTAGMLGGRGFAALVIDADEDPRVWMEAGARACTAHASGPAPALIGEDSTHQIIAPFGVLLFAYGQSVELVRKYGTEAVQTAEALKRTNPGLPIAIATNFPNASISPGSKERLFHTPPFALVLPIRHDHMVYPSTVRPRYEWVTRAHYMALSPFELTLTLDSHTLPCTADDPDEDALYGSETHRLHASAAVDGARKLRPWRGGDEVTAALSALPSIDSPLRSFDLAFNTFLTSGRPHNWALLYYTRAPAMRALFTDWYMAYLAQGGDDQGPLEHAARLRARAGGLRLSRLHTNFVGAFERVDDFQRSDWPRVTHVLSGAVHLFHVRYGDEPTRRKLCAMLNARAHVRRRRVLIQPRGGHKGLYAHAWPMVFSAEEYVAVTRYSPPPRGHVNELVWTRAACSNGTSRFAAGPDGSGGIERAAVAEEEPLVYAFDQHAQLPCRYGVHTAADDER